jgi:uncharacterized protein
LGILVRKEIKIMDGLELIGAVKTGDYAGAEKLIKDGADVNQQDDQGWTALSFAAGKGDLPMVKLLAESGADVFKVGRDQRTPYLIALAAGHVPVVKYLRDIEEKAPGEKPQRPQRKYCKAFHMDDLRKYPKWSENQINRDEKNNGDAGAALPDDDVVFLHQDFTVTRSAWHNEDVIFNAVDPAWEEFCINSLNFKIPDDLDLIVPTTSTVD